MKSYSQFKIGKRLFSSCSSSLITATRSRSLRYGGFNGVKRINGRFSTVSSIPSEQQQPNSSSSSENAKTKKTDDDDDFLSRHGGKVAIVALSVAVGLIYTWFLGTRDRGNVEKAIEHAETILEPYEVLELRHFNRITESQMKELILKMLEDDSSSASHFPILSHHYGERGGDNTSEVQTNTESNSEPLRSIKNIPFWSYRQLIAFIQKNKNHFHQNFSTASSLPSPPPPTPSSSSSMSFFGGSKPSSSSSPASVPSVALVHMDFLVDRLILGRLSRDFPEELTNATLPGFRENPYNKRQANHFHEEEKIMKEKGKFFLAEKNKELFRLYPFDSLLDYYQLISSSSMRNPTRSTVLPLSYQEIPLSLDYLLVVLSSLMQREEHSFPVNIYERMNALFVVALLISGYNQGKNSQEIKEMIADYKNQTISRDSLLRIIYLLQITNQFPPEKQVIETGVKWPVKLHRRKSPFDMISAFEELDKKNRQTEQIAVRDNEIFIVSLFIDFIFSCFFSSFSSLS
jgi:hypothetical protein